MKRAKHAETIFAQLTIIVSLLLGPLTTAIIVTMLSPEDQGQYYVLTALGALIGVLHLGDLETAITGIDRTDMASFDIAVLGLVFSRLVALVLCCLVILLMVYCTTMLGTNARQAKLSVFYFLLITANALVAVPHQLSQALAQPYWRRRFYEFATYSLVLIAGLFLARDTTALIFAVAASILANCLFSSRVLLVTGFLKFYGSRFLLAAVAFWCMRIFPRQRSVGLAHIYSQIGYRLLVPIASESLGVVFAGKIGATLSVLGFSLGLLQQRLRVRFPKLAHLQNEASKSRAPMLRRVENKASFQIGLGVIASGVAMAVGLAELSDRYAWMKDRFLLPGEVLVLASVLALVGIAGVNAAFCFATATDKSRDFWLIISIAAAVALPIVGAGLAGVLGFWVGALVGPILIFLVFRTAAFLSKLDVN
jgi:hypothetical protein